MLMPDIELAYRGEVERLKACFGGGKSNRKGGSKGDEQPVMRPATAENIRKVLMAFNKG